MEEVALDKALNIFQASLHQAADISELLKMFTDAPKSLNEEDKALVESNKEMLEALRDRLLAVDT
ncbi:MAG: hypothetical protein DRP42_01305 [Tenericutes bacterium]|nr:MAG: hypothetical protein DRP42_01305 [Mycoplasmatota bacterium]